MNFKISAVLSLLFLSANSLKVNSHEHARIRQPEGRHAAKTVHAQNGKISTYLDESESWMEGENGSWMDEGDSWMEDGDSWMEDGDSWMEDGEGYE